MNARGFACTASVSDGRRIVPMGMGRLGFPLDFFEGARRSVRNFFNEHLSSENRALFKALIQSGTLFRNLIEIVYKPYEFSQRVNRIDRKVIIHL